MSFETSAELSLTVDEGDLQNVKQQIESEIGTTAVGVTDGGSMSAQSAGGGQQPRDPSTGQFMSIEGVEQRVIEQTEVVEDIRNHAAQLTQATQAQLNAEKPWGEHIDLNERRNELLEDLKDSMEFGNTGRTSRLGSMGGGLALGGIALGVGALSSVLSSFSWPSLPKLEQPGWLPPEINRPDWLPLGLPEPDPLPVEQPPSKYPVESPPSKYPVEEPGSKYPIEEPGIDYPLEEPETDYPLEEPQEPYPVEEPDPIQVEFGMPDVSQKDLLAGLGVGGAAVAGGVLGKFLSGRAGARAGAGTRGLGIPAPSFLIGDRAAEARREDPDERGFIDRKLAGLTEGLGGIGGTRMMFAGGGGEGSLASIIGPVARATLASSIDHNFQREPVSTSVENDVNADISPQITINADTDRLVDEVGREFDDAIADVRRDLIDRIEELESDLNELERDLRR